MSHRALSGVIPILPCSEGIIEPGGRSAHKPWGLDEVSVDGPDDLRVRIGWCSETTQ